MLKWNGSMLSNRDLVHLSGQGYKLKGQLIAEAYENTYNWFLKRDTAIKLVYNIDSLAHPPVDSNAIKNQPVTTIQYKWVYHRVTRGQTIFGIASWYGVTAYQIKVWNRLRNNYLWIGQLLKIYAPVKVPVTSPPAPQNPVTPIQTPIKDSAVLKPQLPPQPITKPSPQPQPLPKPKPQTQTPVQVKPKPSTQPKAVYYTVKKGETLFSIAKKFGTSTSAIQKLNNMRTTNLKIGQVLRVK